ncbi:MAG: N-acetylneuraminate synthase [Flavobacteriaceae bacterium]|nr:N-acetylneuraminate synthase [Flavobacteriaceae bacterium]
MSKTYIIAEAGVNHNGSIEIAKKMIDEAAEFGADAVKFQSFKAEKLVSKLADKADYQKETTDKNESQYEMIKKLELDVDAHRELLDYCNKIGIEFLSSPFDLESIDLLNELGLELFKIPSGEIINLPYLEKIGKLNKKVILSTGMSDLGEIEDSLDVLINNRTEKENITVLQCNTEYPTPYEDVNLLGMITIKNAFNVKVGFSDHTPGIEVPIAAVALGAEIIEKYFTLDRNMEGPDHKASLEPPEFEAMVKAIRNVEKALGNGIKKPSPSETKNIPIARKSIIAINPIKKGEIFTVDNIGIKRPGNGISPMRWYKTLGNAAQNDYKEDEII